MADMRLMCDNCGETGKVINIGNGFVVTARCSSSDDSEDGRSLLCRTSRYPSEDAAIAAWEKMWERDQ